MAQRLVLDQMFADFGPQNGSIFADIWYNIYYFKRYIIHFPFSNDMNFERLSYLSIK